MTMHAGGACRADRPGGMTEYDGRRIMVECVLTSGGKETAHGTGTFVRVATDPATERRKLRSSPCPNRRRASPPMAPSVAAKLHIA